MTDAVVIARPPCQALSRKFRQPSLDRWSQREAAFMGFDGDEADETAREARITALGMLLGSSCATPLWQRIVYRQERTEILARTPHRVAIMELALMESLRLPRAELEEYRNVFGDSL